MGSDDKRLELLPGTLYMLILKTLARLGPSHGYGIAQFIKQTPTKSSTSRKGRSIRLCSGCWSRMVTADWQRTANNRQARVYRLTPAGRKQLTSEVSDYATMIDAISRSSPRYPKRDR